MFAGDNLGSGKFQEDMKGICILVHQTHTQFLYTGLDNNYNLVHNNAWHIRKSWHCCRIDRIASIVL